MSADLSKKIMSLSGMFGCVLLTFSVVFWIIYSIRKSKENENEEKAKKGGRAYKPDTGYNLFMGLGIIALVFGIILIGLALTDPIVY